MNTERWRERATGWIVRLVAEFSRPTAPAFHYEDEHPEEWWSCPQIDFELNFERIDPTNEESERSQNPWPR